jgi:2-haloalkanoic acid dehalogenase type II
MIRVIAFDVFGTVFDFSSVSRSEIAEYVSHVKSNEEYTPLKLPDHWGQLPAHADSAEGIRRLREKFVVVTMSNCPMALLIELSRRNKIDWDGIIPIECYGVYKPDPGAYLMILPLCGVKPSEVMMVTANPTFGDIEASASLGMTPQTIRTEGNPSTIIELAESLGC